MAAWWVANGLVRVGLGPSSRKIGLGLAALGLCLGGNYNCASDVRLLALPMLLLLYHFLAKPRMMDGPKLVLAAAIGLTGLVKFTSLVAGGIVIVAITVDGLMRRDRRPVPLLCWVIAVAMAWMAAGQSLGDFAGYISSSIDITAGYPDAMGLPSPNEGIQLLAFLIGAAATIICLWLGTRNGVRRHPALLLIAFGLWLFIVYRCGYVRHDVHELTATMLLLACCVSIVLATMNHILRAGQRTFRGVSIFITLLVAVKSLWDWHQLPVHRFLLGNLAEVAIESGELARLTAGQPSRTRIEWERGMADIRQAIPLLPVDGTVDVVPRNVTAAIANGLRYQPRPTLQSYAALSPRLAALNAAAIAGPNGPANLFVSTDRDNEHHITLDDSRVWLEILEKYQFKQMAGTHLHLVRREKPRTIRMTPLADSSITLGQQVTLFQDDSGAPNGLIWAQVECDETFQGWLTGQLYRPPSLYMRIWTFGQTTGSGRLVRSLAADGFLLGPVPADQPTLIQMLSDTPDRAMLAAKMPRMIAIGTLHPDSARWSFAPQARLKLFRVTFE